MVTLELDMFTAVEVEEPKVSADEGCEENAVDTDDMAETAELDGKLKLGKELVDAVMPAKLTAAAAAVVAEDCIVEEVRPPNGGTDGVDATEAEVGEAAVDAITLEVAPTEDANGADEEEPKLNEKDFEAPMLEKRGAEEEDELAVEAMLPKPKEGWEAELPIDIEGCKVTAEDEVVLEAGDDKTIWGDGAELDELEEGRAPPKENEDVEEDGNRLEKRVPEVVLDEVAGED